MVVKELHTTELVCFKITKMVNDMCILPQFLKSQNTFLNVKCINHKYSWVQSCPSSYDFQET